MIKKNCPQCNKVFRKPYWTSLRYWNTERKFCSKKCADNAKKGVHASPLTEFKKGQVSLRKGKKRQESPEQYKKRVSKLPRGSSHYNWKGGVTPIHEKIRKSTEYKLWRLAVLRRDRFTCVFCGKKGVQIHADHIKRFSDFPELRFAIDNGRTLCKECHLKTDTWGRKSLIGSN